MFEKSLGDLLYTRENFSFEEKLYVSSIEMRIALGKMEKMKYGGDDKYLQSEDFKQGFIAGVKIMSSMLLDL